VLSSISLLGIQELCFFFAKHFWDENVFVSTWQQKLSDVTTKLCLVNSLVSLFSCVSLITQFIHNSSFLLSRLSLLHAPCNLWTSSNPFSKHGTNITFFTFLLCTIFMYKKIKIFLYFSASMSFLWILSVFPNVRIGGRMMYFKSNCLSFLWTYVEDLCSWIRQHLQLLM
jgi:hypothetical protein